MRRGLIFAGLALCIAVCTGSAAQDRKIQVAAAADLKFAMAELAQKFEDQSGTKVAVTYGSSGNFFSQIQNGAPFDVFFSADIAYPRKLAAAGIADAATIYEYAIGRIVIWTLPDARVDVTRDGWKALLEERVQKIAIANPEHAPYGKAAVAAMQKAGIYEQVKAKLVYGENISQAAQFVQSGSTQAGILALSLAASPAMRRGKCWVIPAEMHAPIEQAAIVLRGARNSNGAAAFLEFVKGAAGREILARFGFQPPDGAADSR
jgi:molybdate transport system substrate-binding protein